MLCGPLHTHCCRKRLLFCAVNKLISLSLSFFSSSTEVVVGRNVDGDAVVGAFRSVMAGVLVGVDGFDVGASSGDVI